MGQFEYIGGYRPKATIFLNSFAFIFVHSPTLTLTASICWLLFVVFVTVSELRSVLKGLPPLLTICPRR